MEASGTQLKSPPIFVNPWTPAQTLYASAANNAEHSAITAPATQPRGLTTNQAKETPKKKSFFKRWKFWLILGGIVIALALVLLFVFRKKLFGGGSAADDDPSAHDLEAGFGGLNQDWQPMQHLPAHTTPIGYPAPQQQGNAPGSIPHLDDLAQLEAMYRMYSSEQQQQPQSTLPEHTTPIEAPPADVGQAQIPAVMTAAVQQEVGVRLDAEPSTLS